MEGSLISSAMESLPPALLETILIKLDISSLCSVATSCKTLNACALQVLSFLPNFHLIELAPTFDLLRNLLRPNQCLRSLKVDCHRLDDSSIDHLFRPSLQEICLLNCENFSGELLFAIGRQCRDLRYLSLGSIVDERGRAVLISDLEELLNGCTMLESLSLMFDVSIFDRHDFAQVWKTTCRKLLVLEIGYVGFQMVTELLASNVDPRVHQIQPSVLPNLQKLSLSVDCITDSLVGMISQGLKSLTHLDLKDSPMFESTFMFDLTNTGLQQINQNKKLKHLSLVRSQEYFRTYFRRVNDLGVLFMADTFSSLESIYLGGFCRVTDAGFRAILHSSSSLKKLRICSGIRLTDLVFHDISATSLSLTHVCLRWCYHLTDLSIIQLSSNTDIRILDLRDCRLIGDESLKAIGKLSKLKGLLVDGTDITDVGSSYLAPIMNSLESLSVRGCRRLTDACIPAIFGSSPRRVFQFLDLSRIPNLSDNAILSLAKNRIQIVDLRIRECPHIGDTSVMALAAMQVGGTWLGSSLRLLDIYDSGGVTKLAIRWFKKPYFPRLRWLGVTGSINRDMVFSLTRSRPFLHIECHGEESSAACWDSLDGSYWDDLEEVDDLERWILEGTDEEIEAV